MIYNSTAYENAEDEKVRKFLQYVCTNKPEKNDEFSNRISELVEQIKKNEQFRSLYAAMNLHDRDLTRRVRAEALAEGAQQKAIEAALNFSKNGVSIEIIAKSLNIPTEEIEKIIAKEK